MALRGQRLTEAQFASGLPLDQIKFDAQSNIRAAASWFSQRADALEIDRLAGPGSWSPVVADYAGLRGVEDRWTYVNNEVFANLRKGIEFQDPLKARVQVEIPALPELETHLPIYTPLYSAGPDYSGSVWKASPNHSKRPSGKKGKVQMIIIHSCEGNYAGCVGWLSKKKSKVSAHYVVNSNGSEISQMVRHHRKAWHIGAKYNCNLNGRTLCGLDNAPSNGFTIGIEHAGFASQKSWDSGLLEASAKLTCAISKKHGIPRDDQHIVAHGQLRSNRTDPGENWPWGDYLRRVRRHCGEGSSNEIVVDNNNNQNDARVAKAKASGNWKRSSSTKGHWGPDYQFAEKANKSDGFEFRFYLAKDEARTIDAWWTSGSNRSAKAPFVVFDAKGKKLGTVNKNQRRSGSQWNRLGRYNFKRGWNRVVLSRWTNSGKVVMADAIRVR